MGELEIDHLLDCISLNLYDVSTTTNQTSLRAAIGFSEQAIEILGGCIYLGVKRFKFKLAVLDGEISLENREKSTLLALEPWLEERETEGDADSTVEGVTATIITNTKGTTGSRRRVQQILVSKSDTELVYILEAKRGQVLAGQLLDVEVGTLNIAQKPCTVEASIEVEGQRDLALTGITNLVTGNISQNKLALLERELFLRFIASKIDPCIIKMEKRYE